uniref:hydroxymethylbilane synthase n=1 Tax=Arcella intermedia TaxID=1963864 RepID=A0A6B2LB14_9EUKA
MALVQTHMVIDALKAANEGTSFQLKTMTTKGDQILNVALAKIGDKGLFTHELEQSILDGTVDFAVHSLKDLPTSLPPKMIIGAVTKREVEGDVVIFRKDLPYKSLAELPPNSTVGSSSLRRIAQLKMSYPLLKFKDIRGNLNTRFNKLDDPGNEYSCIILAASGVQRLGSPFVERISAHLEDLYWAPGQGALAVETSQDNLQAIKLLKSIHNQRAYVTCTAERSFLEALGGGCQVPLGVKTSISEDGQRLVLDGIVLNLDGTEHIQGTTSGPLSEPIQIGQQLANQFLAKGAAVILEQVRNASK